MLWTQPVGSFFTRKLDQVWMHLGNISGADQNFSQKTSLVLSSCVTQLDTTDKGIGDESRACCSSLSLGITCLSMWDAQGQLFTSDLSSIYDLGYPIYQPLREASNWAKEL